ncbi:MAG: pro-sigmaK processing inhibitor BofA family protein [Schaedlerella sp.]|nr:pro-sigmaK processing inhibitor BofA family protein [Schaedlerella sp.]
MKEQTKFTGGHFIVRAVTGLLLIYGINQYILPESSPLKVGVNVLSFIVSGVLGVPGVGLLYGILLCQIW